jgi:hypothetical protein
MCRDINMKYMELTQIMVHVFTLYATIILFALHVSTLMGHHQVLSVTQRMLLNHM